MTRPAASRPDRGILRTAVSLFVCAAALAGVLWSPRFVIERPRLGIPAILKAGQDLRVELRESLPLGPGGIGLALERGGESVPLPVARSFREGPRRVLSAPLPPAMSAGAWDLVVTRGAAESRLAKAVHVVERFPDTFRVVHMTDLHIGWGPEGDQAAARAVEEINIINPSLVLVSGDLAHSGASEEYSRVLDLLSRLDAPVICAPGNHDHKGWKGYLSSFGFPYNRVDFGTWSVFSLHSGHGRDQMTESQFRWLAREFKKAREGRSLVHLHHPLFGYRSLQGMADELAGLFREVNVPLVLSGNSHYDTGFDSGGEALGEWLQTPGTRYLVTASAGGDPRTGPSGVEPHYGYRLLTIDNGTVTSATCDYDGDGKRDPVSSIPTGNLEMTVTGPRSVLAVNNLFESFSGARVRIPHPENCILGDGSGEEAYRTFETDIPARTRLPLRLSPLDDSLQRSAPLKPAKGARP